MKRLRGWLFGLVVVFCFVGSGYSALLWYQGTDLRNIKADPMASFEPEGLEPNFVFVSKGTRGSLVYLKHSSAIIHRSYTASSQDEIDRAFAELHRAAREAGWGDDMRKTDPSMKLSIGRPKDRVPRIYVRIESP